MEGLIAIFVALICTGAAVLAGFLWLLRHRDRQRALADSNREHDQRVRATMRRAAAVVQSSPSSVVLQHMRSDRASVRIRDRRTRNFLAGLIPEMPRDDLPHHAADLVAMIVQYAQPGRIVDLATVRDHRYPRGQRICQRCESVEVTVDDLTGTFVQLRLQFRDAGGARMVLFCTGTLVGSEKRLKLHVVLGARRQDRPRPFAGTSDENGRHDRS